MPYVHSSRDLHVSHGSGIITASNKESSEKLRKELNDLHAEALKLHKREIEREKTVWKKAFSKGQISSNENLDSDDKGNAEVIKDVLKFSEEDKKKLSLKPASGINSTLHKKPQPGPSDQPKTQLWSPDQLFSNPYGFAAFAIFGALGVMGAMYHFWSRNNSKK